MAQTTVKRVKLTLGHPINNNLISSSGDDTGSSPATTDYELDLSDSESRSVVLTALSSDVNKGSLAADGGIRIGKKRKRGRPPMATVAELSPPPPKTITYIISLFSAEELAKPETKQKPRNVSLNLKTDEPWDTMKAQLLVKIDITFSPWRLKFDDYEVMYYIRGAIPKPGIPLTNDAEYASLVNRVLKSASATPTVNITIELTSSGEPVVAKGKENIPDGGGIAKDGEKMKGKKKHAVLPGNEARARNIQALQECWQCVDQRPSCVGAYCYTFPDSKDHHPLNPAHLDIWASAMLKGDDSATIEKPPNHPQFDPQCERFSPVLQRCIDARDAKTAAQPLLQPVIVTLNDPRVPGPASIPVPGTGTVTTMLLEPHRIVGPEMTVLNFCTAYSLPTTILNKLTENAYTHASHLRFVSLKDLDETGFKGGEKAGLHDAIERWSLPQAA